MNVTFSNKGCKAFFKKYPHNFEEAKRKIEKAIAVEIKTNMKKVKLATRNKVNGLSCYEMCLNLGKIGSVRIAFTLEKDQAIVYYLTTILQKDKFSKALDKALFN